MMKKMLSLLAAVTLMTTCAAAETTHTDVTEPAAEAWAGMADPWTELSSLEELNEAADMNLQLPPVMGVTVSAYRLLSTDEQLIAEVIFEVNGQSFRLRGSPEFDTDISGIYMEDGNTAFAGHENECRTDVLTDEVKAARWMDINGQYVLSADDATAVDAETFTAMADELQEVTNPDQPIVLPEGTYYDTTSERAAAEVKSLGNDAYAITVHWADSAFEYTEWTMTAVMGEDGTLSYQDCVEKLVSQAEEGEPVETVANLIPDGFFIPTENAIAWTGAAEESCRDCVFVYSEEE